MSKVLKPYTIIPPDLYVQRDADRQLANIINDMGRPGYVLVSRQMGKTNLLLNAKRTLENHNDFFIYVDLSNPFDSAKACFQNIVDTALETHEQYFSGIKDAIVDQRKQAGSDLPAHKQHTNELRLLLRTIPGKIIITLDEIDALTKTAYSDQVFAQIRSIYFTRINYPELERLTYILSGVIEPTEIIRDPKISPFNIGQKIFLNDFSLDEFEQFIRLSKLKLTAEIKERIYYWTEGNPRLTWDLCSEIENIFDKSQELNINTLDRIVKEMYLTLFDKPPIDNIRELVKNDREIRNSIIEIEYKKGKELPQKVKNKLYLAGIINYEDSNIRLKNQIVRESLALTWIKSLEEEEKGILKIALDLFEKGDYAEALLNFKNFLQTNQFPESKKDICYYYMAYAEIIQKNYQDALYYFDVCSFDLDDQPSLHFNREFLKGTAYRLTKDYDKSRESFEYVVKNGRKDLYHLKSKISLGHLLMNFFREEVNQAKLMFNEIIDDKNLYLNKIKPEDFNYYESAVYQNLATLAKGEQDDNSARRYIDVVLPHSTGPIRFSLLLLLSEVSNDVEEKKRLLNELLEGLLSPEKKQQDASPEMSRDLDFIELKTVLLAIYKVDNRWMREVIKEKPAIIEGLNIGQFLYDLGLYAMQGVDWNCGVQIMKDNFDASENGNYSLDELIEYNTLRFLAYANFEGGQEYIKKFIYKFSKSRLEAVDYIDMQIFNSHIAELYEKKDFSGALRCIKSINEVKSKVDDSLLINYLAIFNLELQVYHAKGDHENSLAVAMKIQDLLNDARIANQKSNLLGETGLEIIRTNAQYIINPKSKTRLPIISSRTYGRNQILTVKYKDGRTTKAKYKKLESDILNGECIVVHV